MKSSTIRRSTLSKESIEVIEALAKENPSEEALGEYVRPEESVAESDDSFANKAQEIDLLWQNFKATQFSSDSPTAYILSGFVAGVLVSVVCFVCLGLVFTKSGKSLHIGNKALFAPAVSVEKSLDEQVNAAQEEVEARVSLPAEDEVAEPVEVQQESAQAPVENSKMKKYIVKDGDTVESIIIKNYGSYTPARAEAIMKANNMKSLDRINIDQELLIPVE
ncbi:MAG: LysM peptidoglycan-binding domain-containing protein [Muribaculaceae bacterium]|nr:LysM peptidoglycan-binding domain-containing protein [Muribaculaceae bacterium]